MVSSLTALVMHVKVPSPFSPSSHSLPWQPALHLWHPIWCSGNIAGSQRASAPGFDPRYGNCKMPSFFGNRNTHFFTLFVGDILLFKMAVFNEDRQRKGFRKVAGRVVKEVSGKKVLVCSFTLFSFLPDV